MGFKHLALNSSNLVGFIDHDGATLASFPAQTSSAGSEMQHLGGEEGSVVFNRASDCKFICIAETG